MAVHPAATQWNAMRHHLSFSISLISALVLLLVSSRFVVDFFLVTIFQNLHFHLALIAVVAVSIALVIRFNIFGVIVLMAAIGLSIHGYLLSQRYAVATVDTPGPAFRLISFNVLGTNTENANAIADEILGSRADVVNIMEARGVVPALPRLFAAYPYRIGCGEQTKSCDLMMLSRYPLKNGTIQSLSQFAYHRFITARVQLPAGEVNVAAIHLTKPYFDAYHDEELQGAARMLGRLNGPLVLSGDFNASSISPDMLEFLRQTGLKAAKRQPATWPIMAGSLGVPIDHIYIREPLAFRHIQRIADNHGSNHYGLVADLGLPLP
ncbi:endonuclease/exonuclease/phosphatase family protein [Rhizobium sp. SGZ-381]|uniref:endonuclease/exonuclease/phosphatase family protein n=1 Tax=Rhizobium sp. SGZ-381 TaxID=3342800 RepID=UPI00366B212B